MPRLDLATEIDGLNTYLSQFYNLTCCDKVTTDAIGLILSERLAFELKSRLDHIKSPDLADLLAALTLTQQYRSRKGTQGARPSLDSLPEAIQARNKFDAVSAAFNAGLIPADHAGMVLAADGFQPAQTPQGTLVFRKDASESSPVLELPAVVGQVALDNQRAATVLSDGSLGGDVPGIDSEPPLGDVIGGKRKPRGKKDE